MLVLMQSPKADNNQQPITVDGIKSKTVGQSLPYDG